MIVKFTEIDHNLFTMMESQEEKEWFINQKKMPVDLLLVSSFHSYMYSEKWYEDNIHTELWHHFKRHQ